MTLPVEYDDRQFGEGDTVRSYDNDDRVDWLWLDPTDYPNASPFTAHTAITHPLAMSVDL